MIEIRQISSWEEAAIYQNEWNDIIEKNLVCNNDTPTVPTIYQTFEWNHTWWQAYGETNEYLLLLLGAFDQSKLMGIAPLMIRVQKFPFPKKTVHFIGASNSNFASDYCSFITESEQYHDIVTAFLCWLSSHSNLWDMLDLRNIPEESNDLPLLQKHFKKYSELLYLCDAPACLLDGNQQNQYFLNNKNIRRKINWFNRQGELSYRLLESSADIHSRLEHFFETHRERRSFTRHPSLFHNENHRTFYRLVTHRLAPLNYLNFLVVELNGTPVAYHFGFKFKNKLIYYTPAINIKISHSPGIMLIKGLFEYALASNLSELDFTAGGEPYKYKYSNKVRKLYRFCAFRSRLYFALFLTENKCRSIAREILFIFRKNS